MVSGPDDAGGTCEIVPSSRQLFRRFCVASPEDPMGDEGPLGGAHLLTGSLPEASIPPLLQASWPPTLCQSWSRLDTLNCYSVGVDGYLHRYRTQ